MGLRVEHVGFGDDRVDYERAWQLQRDVHAGVAAGLVPDTVLLLEHPPVYTAGRRTARSDRPMDGTPVVDVDRGGRITWHGPGQLVGYPIVRLTPRTGGPAGAAAGGQVDVVAYVRRLEDVLIAVCADLGLPAGRIDGRSGVWLPADAVDGAGRGATGRRERKVAAIGVRVAQGVTMHGFALNCDPDLSWFTRIVPCGIPDADVTSLTAELGRRVTVTDVLPLVEARLRDGDLTGTRGGRSHEQVSPARA